jgi:Icc-related predicted phosphoesterase
LNIFYYYRQPEFCKWAFNVPRGKACLDKWAHIPSGTDILITHTPPLGHGDLCCSGIRAGCVELLTEVQSRVQPRYHVFGHIHEGNYLCKQHVMYK